MNRSSAALAFQEITRELVPATPALPPVESLETLDPRWDDPSHSPSFDESDMSLPQWISDVLDDPNADVLQATRMAAASPALEDELPVVEVEEPVREQLVALEQVLSGLFYAEPLGRDVIERPALILGQPMLAERLVGLAETLETWRSAAAGELLAQATTAVAPAESPMDSLDTGWDSLSEESDLKTLDASPDLPFVEAAPVHREPPQELVRQWDAERIALTEQVSDRERRIAALEAQVSSLEAQVEALDAAGKVKDTELVRATVGVRVTEVEEGLVTLAKQLHYYRRWMFWRRPAASQIHNWTTDFQRLDQQWVSLAGRLDPRSLERVEPLRQALRSRILTLVGKQERKRKKGALGGMSGAMGALGSGEQGGNREGGGFSSDLS